VLPLSATANGDLPFNGVKRPKVTVLPRNAINYENYRI
jgi:hypothetical protein